MWIIFWIGLLIVSITVLVKASDFFTDSAEKIGIFLGIPQFIVGVTFVAVGTSLPELISSLIAVGKGASEIVVANVVGSNITNVFLVLGFAAVICKKISIKHDILKIDLPLLLGTAFLLGIQIYDGIYTTFEAVLSIISMLLYFAYTLYHKHDEVEHIKDKSSKKNTSHKKTTSKESGKTALSKKKTEKKVDEKDKTGKKKLGIWPIIILILSGVGIYLGAEYTILAVLKISEIMKIGTEIIAVGAIALGTSLPELAVTISAAKKGNTGMIAGNVLGSNIFNATLVMGVSGLAGNLIIPANIIAFGLPLMIIATILFVVTTQDRKITLWEGLSFLLFYVFFIGNIVREILLAY